MQSVWHTTGLCWNTELVCAHPRGDGEAFKTREVEILLTRFSYFVFPGGPGTQKAFHESMPVGCTEMMTQKWVD